MILRWALRFINYVTACVDSSRNFAFFRFCFLVVVPFLILWLILMMLKMVLPLPFLPVAWFNILRMTHTLDLLWSNSLLLMFLVPMILNLLGISHGL